MNHSVEEIWRNETARRKRLRNWMLFIVCGFLILSVFLWAMVTQPLLSSVEHKDTGATVNSSRLHEHVRLFSTVFVPRDEKHVDNLDRAALYIRQEFEKANGLVSEQPYEVKGRTYKNVIALFGPDTKERIIIGAHYDAAGEYPAADDNASGVAGLLELAHLLQNARLPMQVELVAYTLEEPPYFRTELMGSAVHAKSLKEQGMSVRLMISLEMIGYFTDAPSSQHFPAAVLGLFYPSRGNFIAVVGRFGQVAKVRVVKRAMREASTLPVYSINAPGFVPGIDFSDHLNYWQAGYEAVMITDTSFYRNRNYHTPNDKPDTLDYSRLAMVVQGVYAAVLEVAQ
jgi:hypothetical protein